MNTDIFEQYMGSREHSHLIGPSSLHTCIRQHAYAYLGCEPTDTVDKSAANFGTLVHLGYSAMIRSMYDPAEREPDVKIDWGGPRSGTADDVWWSNFVVTDLKVPGGRSYQWQLDHGPKREYTDQLHCYAHGLTLKHGDFWTCRLFLINRDDPSQRHTFEFPYDRDRALELVEEANSKHESLTAAASLGSLTASATDRYLLAEQFPRESPGPDKFPSSWCPFKTRCWPQPDNPDQTALSAEIEGNLEEILEHANAYFDANALASEWKKKADEQRAYLAGLDGVYSGDGLTIKVTTVGGNERPDVPDETAMAAILDSLGLDVPMKPQKPSARWTKVERKK